MLSVGLVALPGALTAQQIDITSDITESTTWTANNTYNLAGQQIYVLPGATLTIEAGTVIASVEGGSLAVTRGAKIYALGTENNPIIFTSDDDVATWDVNPLHPTGGNPKTGSWREAALEWGNLTIMGRAFMNEDEIGTNVPGISANNYGDMEGLTAAFPGDPNVRYGGGDDLDNSGSLSYVSFRYGGKVASLTKELNGLSLGALGRGTDIHHVEIMNNVDDGIEVWGGCVDLKYLSIWNIGDDSLDIDQGYRGRIQFVLIVQGYSVNDSQGSGVGDNCIEVDGSEDSDRQPVTTTTMYNMTVIGQPISGDGMTAWRDGARVQYRNSIFMDGGEAVVRLDNVDGDGGQGYGHNGTLSFGDTWTTTFDNTSSVNAPASPENFYQAQNAGFLSEMTDNVYFRNLNAAAYTQAENIDGTGFNIFSSIPLNNNVKEPVGQPIVDIQRAAPVTRGGLTQIRVTTLDPRPANDALVSGDWAPADGFFNGARYRGAFAPNMTWLCGWTASTAFGFTSDADKICDLGGGIQGAFGTPRLEVTGAATNGSATTIALSNARPNRAGYFIISFARSEENSFGLVPALGALPPVPMVTSPSGEFVLGPLPWGPVPPGLNLYLQFFVFDEAGEPSLFSASNGVLLTTK